MNHGVLNRSRRQEIDLLLEGAGRYLNIPCILTSFLNTGNNSIALFKHKEIVSRLLNTAWDYRDAYHSTNLARLASVFLRRKDNENAGSLFDLAISLNPTCCVTLHKRGNFLFQVRVWRDQFPVL